MTLYRYVRFSARSATGKSISRTVKAIRAIDYFDCIDRLRSRYPTYPYSVIVRFSRNPNRLSADSISAQVARNAGPEEI